MSNKNLCIFLVSRKRNEILIWSWKNPATSTIINNAAFINDVKDRYLDKGHPYIIMTGDNMKPFNTRITDSLDPSGITMSTQEYHTENIVTGDHLFTRDGTYFILIKQDAARDK